jgi:RNA polymerase sigma factor (sigma-70 family)
MSLMMNRSLSHVIRHLRKTMLQDQPALTDGQLLESFVHDRDDAALAALVRRHGPMVWGVCHRLLRHDHDAEDAFQATFLVLVRKAATIRDKAKVANWLYGVARQTAVRARTAAVKRSVRERQMKEMPEPAVVEASRWTDLQPLLDQELSRLPELYRVAIVVCDLEGKTRQEAARQLGWPEGSVAGRLARARTMLAKRLARHGLAGALGMVLSQGTASAVVPVSVVRSTSEAAHLLAAGQAATGVISPAVTALTEGVLKAMFMRKLKITTALLALVFFVGLGVGAMIYDAKAEQPTAKAQQDTNAGDAVQDAKKDAGESRDEAKIIAELVDAAKEEWTARRQAFAAGRETQEFLYTAARRLLQAELEKAKKQEERIAAWQAHLDRLAEVERVNKDRYEVGRISSQDYQASRFWRLEAELGLARAKRP